MNNRPLVLDSSTRELVARVMTYACEHPIDLAEMKRRVANGKPIGDDPGCAMEVPFGYRIAFSIEQQPGGWTRHISMSVPEKGKFPNEIAVLTIMGMFGFHRGLTDSDGTWIEAEHAINVIEALRDDEDPRAIHLAEPWRAEPFSGPCGTLPYE